MESDKSKSEQYISYTVLRKTGSISDNNKNLLKYIFEFLNIQEVIIILKVCRKYSKIIMTFKLVQQYIQVRIFL